MFRPIVHLSGVNLNTVGRPVSCPPFHAEPIGVQSLVFAILTDTSGAIMIQRFIGMTALSPPWRFPRLAQAQGVPGGIERGARDGERAAGPSEAWSVASLAAWSEASPGCWASTSGRVSAAMWSNSTAHLIAIARTSGSAPSCRRRASPITMCRRNMASTLPLYGRQRPHGSGRAAHPPDRRDRRIDREA